MIFPSSGQNVHTIKLSFPGSEKEDNESGKKAPKFVRSDSEKRIPVVDVEKTSQGAKIKFVHHGIRMVMYEDSKLTKEDIIRNVKVNPQQAETFAAHQAGVFKQAQVHVHDSDELMPDFLEKLTVGKYAPEKAVQNYLQGTGRIITDSYISTISGLSPPRSPQQLIGEAGMSEKVDVGKHLLLDQYLSVQSYGMTDPAYQPFGSRGGSPGRLGSAFGSLAEFEPPPGSPIGGSIGDKKDSPKRVDVPALALSSTSSDAADAKSQSHAPSVHDVTTPADGALRNMTFDDSAPTTAIPGPKKAPAAELVKQLSSIPDVLGSHNASPRPSAPTDTLSPVVPSSDVKMITPSKAGMFDGLPSPSQMPPFESPFNPNESPKSTKSEKFEAQFDLQQLLDAPIPTTHVPRVPVEVQSVASGSRSSIPVQGVTVKVDGNTVASPKAEKTVAPASIDYSDVSARSIGLDSLSALSDSLSQPGNGEHHKDKHSTRAVQLREQMTKANLVRMDALVKKGTETTMYTSKTLVGVSAPSTQENREKMKNKLVAAARLVVAFRPQPKAKHIVGKEDEHEKTGPSFVLRTAPPEAPHAPVPHKPPGGYVYNTKPAAAGEAPDAHHALPDSFRPLEKKHSMSLSVMTDSVDDSPSNSQLPSPVHEPITQTKVVDGLPSGRRASELKGGDHRLSDPPIRAHRPSETPAAPAVSKQALFDFKPPEDTPLPSRKNVGNFISKLKSRVGAAKAKAVEEIEMQDADQTSVVTSYFDHNAAPIFVEREKGEKHVLHSKRFDKQEAKEYKPRRNSEIDEGDVEEGRESWKGMYEDHEAPPGSSPAFVKPDSPDVVKPVKPNFDLQKFMSSVSPEEREAMASLPIEAINKIMESMNETVGGAPKAKAVNKKTVSYFKSLIDKMKAEKLELDRLNMDLTMELLDSSDSAVSVTVSSVVGGSAIILIVKETSEHLRQHPYTIMTSAAVEAMKELVAFECREIAPDSFTDVTFSNLRPETGYIIYAISDSSNVKQVPITDEDKVPMHLVINTLPEVLEVEWPRLTTEMQILEIRAALRTNWLREAAAAFYPPIVLPVDDDIHLGDNLPEEESRSAKKNKKGATTGPTPDEKQKEVWRLFLDWWVGQSPMVVTKIRGEFHLREALFAAQQESVTKRYLESTLTTKEGVAALSKYAEAMTGNLATGKVKKDGLPSMPEFKKFRSWYKGGQALRDLTEAALRTSKIPPSDHKSTLSTVLQKQLQFRHALLQGRVDDVENCKSVVKDLVAGHQHALEHRLEEDDLMFKRSTLSPADLNAIMSRKRLQQLCVAAGLLGEAAALTTIPIASFGPTGKYNFMAIAKTDLFTILKVRDLLPDDPPPIVMMTLPGTNRKPLKAWQLCNRDEKMMEIAVACSLDIILRHALSDRVAVPNPEDIALPKGKFPTRDAIVEKFVAWYAGEEETDRIPGHSPPTLQRTVFGETWETDCVRSDPFVLETLYENEYPVPEQYFGQSSKMRSSFAAHSTRRSSVSTPVAGKHRAASTLNDHAPYFAPLMDMYIELISKVTGNFLRLSLMARHLSAIIGCRRLAVLRWVWPPGAARTGRQYIFPKTGLITPAFDLPPARIKLFPSRRPDAYTHYEMEHWYPPQVLDEDDLRMVAGEADGVRLRSYHNWLAMEKERQDETRKQMLQEDFDCHMRREITKEVEYRMRTHANKLKLQVERSRENDPDKEMEMKFSASLPAEYWYIFEESQEYKYGSGIHNEDELEEYREAERQRARNAEIEAEKFENYLQEEIMRREAEEAARLKREDQDRRLAEGVARRRRLREHLEELKRAKQYRIAEAEMQRIDAERRRVEEAAIAEMQRVKERERQQEKARAAREQQLMTYEDILVTDNRARSWEVKRMEHEDIRSFMREQYEAQEKIKLEESYEALNTLYRPFEPFPEKMVGDQMRSLHGLLNAGTSVGKIYQDVMDTLSQSSSHRSRVEEVTESVDRKRSDRYIRIYEGARDTSQQADADATTVSSAVKPHADRLPSVQEVHGDVGDGIDDELLQEAEKFTWLRKSQNPPVRSSTHNPTKHSIRANSGALPNTYDMQWSILNNNSAQCFVRTSTETFRSPEPIPSMRKLSALAPIMQPLQETSMFEATRRQKSPPRSPTLQFSAPTPKVSANESEILKKFGSAPFPSVVRAEKSAEKNASTSTALSAKLSSTATPAPVTSPGAAEPFFDDSVLLEDSTLASKVSSKDAKNPAPQEESVQRPVAVTSQGSSAGIAARQEVGSVPAGSAASATYEEPTMTGSIESSLSVFRSLSPLNDHEDMYRAVKQDKKRQKLKQLLSTSADMLAKTDQREWLQFLQTQRKATFASLATLDAKKAAARMRIEKLTAPAGKVVEEDRPLSRSGTGGQLSEVREKKMQVAQLKKELQELGIVDESILDFRTRKMAKSASESVIRMQREKSMLREYVTSGAVLRDEYYLLAVQPGTRTTSSLEVSEEVKKFAAEVTAHVEDNNELQIPSFTSSLATLEPPVPKSSANNNPRPLSSKGKGAPKSNLRFGAYENSDLFIMENTASMVESKLKEPEVILDLGVRSLSRAKEDDAGAVKKRATKPPRKASNKPTSPINQMPHAPLEGHNNSFLSLSLNSLSTVSGGSGLAPTASNPLGVIRGSGVAKIQEAKATTTVKHRGAFYKTSNSLTSAIPQSSGSLHESTRGEISKRGSTLSKSVELYIHTPTNRQRKNASGADDDLDESLGSATDLSLNDHWQLNSPPPKGVGRSGGSVASVGSASIILDEAASI